MTDTTYRRFLRYGRRRLWPYFSLALLFNLGYSASTGLVPLVIRYLFDDILPTGDRNQLYISPLLIIGVMGVRGLSQFLGGYLTELVGQQIIADLRADMGAKVVELPQAYITQHPSSFLVSRILTDVNLVKSGLVDGLSNLIRDTFTLLALVIVAFSQDWLLTLIGFILFPLGVWPGLRSSNKVRFYSRRAQHRLAVLASYVQESLVASKVVRIFGMQTYELGRLQKANRLVLESALLTTRAKLLNRPIMELIGALGFSFVLIYGGEAVINGTRSAGNFLAFLTSLQLCYGPFKGISKANATFQEGLSMAKELFEILDIDADPADTVAPLSLINFSNALEARSVYFSYGQQPVIEDLNLQIPRGHTVALVGISGGGKSTIIDLFCRFYDPQAGSITIDGIDIRELSIQDYRNMIALVDQDTVLFNDSVFCNIGYGKIDATAKEVKAAAIAANAHEFICSLPHGYDTIIGENGTILSGGQRQRIAIARALVRNSPILFLDEATSSLDSNSEALVWDALDQLMQNRTTLVAAHRLSTVVNADTIYVIESGRIVEAGHHRELLARGGRYTTLFSTQFAEGSTYPFGSRYA